MEKIINIGDKEVKISNNVAWTMEYRDQFNKDVLEAIMPIATSLIETITIIINESGADREIDVKSVSAALEGRSFDITLPLTQLGFTDSIVNILWAMAKAADPTTEPPRQWVRQFETFPLDEIVPQVGEMVLSGFTSSKNLARLREMMQGLKPQPKTKD